jgi:hypothetical protein
MPVVQHLAKSAEWGTPQDVIEAARETMGSITFDPCSSAEANLRVRADSWSDNGLAEDWTGERVLLNPPGGRVKLGGKKYGLPFLFWTKLRDSHVRGCVYIGFTLEHLRHNAGMISFPICIPHKRLCFHPLAGQNAPSPGHGNAIVYIPGSEDRTSEFLRIFKEFGDVRG